MILNIPRNSDFSKFQENLDDIMSEPPGDQDDIEELCGWLQRSLIQAGIATFELKNANLRVSKKPGIPKSVPKLCSERRILEGKVKRGTIWKTKYSVAGRIWTDRQQHRLEENMANLANKTRKLSENYLKHKLKTGNKMRATTKIGTKQFWNLLNRVLRSLLCIQAVEDEDGNVITERKQLMDIVLSDLDQVFKGQRSQVFVHKGQQLIKAAKVKYNEDHENWIPDNNQPVSMKPRYVGLQWWRK